MKTLISLALFLAPVLAFSRQPGDTVTIHVSASHWTTIPTDKSASSFEILTAVISGPDMFLPGNYRARLVSEKHESVCELRQRWEILLPGDRSRTFDLIGIRE